MKPMRRGQRGVTLFVGLIMLVLLTVIAITALNAGKSSLQIVGNMQQRNQAITAAQEAIEEAVSTTRLFRSPNSILANPCNGPNTRCVDVNGDGTNDVTVTLTPTPFCVKTHPVPPDALQLPQDKGCVVQVNEEGTIESACTNTMWVIRAQAVDAVTSASVAVGEGVAVRILTSEADTVCP